MLVELKLSGDRRVVMNTSEVLSLTRSAQNSQHCIVTLRQGDGSAETTVLESYESLRNRLADQGALSPAQ